MEGWEEEGGMEGDDESKDEWASKTSECGEISIGKRRIRHSIYGRKTREKREERE